MNKTMTFIVLACLLVVSAAASVCESVDVPQQDKVKAINVDGMKGDIGLVPAQYVPSKPTTMTTTPELAYEQKCQIARIYAFEHQMTLGSGYRIVNCILEKKVRTYTLIPAGRYIAAYDADGNRLPDVHKNMHSAKTDVWTPVQI